MHFLALLVGLGMQDRPFTVEFEGRSAFGESELLRVVDGDVKRYRANPRPAPLDDAVFRLGQYYRSRGYAKARVEAVPEEHRILFKIEEGPLIQLGRVHFVGNTVFTNAELKELLDRSASGRLLPYSRKLLALQSETILAAYSIRGYIDASVADPAEHIDVENARSHVTYRITEGRQYTIASVGPAPPGIEDRFHEYVGRPYDPASIVGAEAAASDHLREIGHPHPVVVATPRIDRVKGTVDIHLDIDAGPVARIGGVEVKGTDRTSEWFVLSRAALERGSLYRASTIREAERNIAKTGLFRAVRVSPGKIQENEVPIQILIEENEPGEASIRAGTGTLDGPRFGADLSYQNLFGMGGLVRVGGTVSRIGVRSDAEFAMPWFLGTDFRPGLSFYWENQELPSFDVTSHGFAPSLVYPLTDRHTLTGGFRQAEIRTSNVDPGVPPGDLLDFQYRALFVSTSLDFRDSTLLPTRGFRILGSFEWTPGSFSTDIEFAKATARADFYVGLPWELVFAVSTQGGLIKPQGDTVEIPISLRFFAGGANTVRGFKYGTIGDEVDGEPTGGELYFTTQMELRFPVWAELHGAFFMDRGGVWLDPDDRDLDDMRWSVGSGFRYHTPAGALSADLAWNVANEDDEDDLVFHFSIGFPF